MSQINKKYKSRGCTLYSDRTMTYSTDRDDATIKGLCDFSVINNIERTSPRTFEVNTSDRVWSFRCQNEGVCTEWFDAIRSQHQNTNLVKELVDLSLFKNIDVEDHCNGHDIANCDSVKRIVEALNLHQNLVKPVPAEDGSETVDWCNVFNIFRIDHYPTKSLLNDHIHFISNHVDPEGLDFVQQRLKRDCGSAAKCGATGRHFRDRAVDSNGPDAMDSNSFMDRMDSIHFMVHHLYELGLRVPVHVLAKELEAKYDDDADNGHFAEFALKRMINEIQSKKEGLQTDRFDGNGNIKFTLNVNDGNGKYGMYYWFKIHFQSLFQFL